MAVQSRRPELLVTLGAVLVLLMVGTPAALGSEFDLEFEDQHDAGFSEIFLDVPDNLEVGAPVQATGI